MATAKTETGPLAPETRAAWYALFVLHRRVMREVEGRLQDAGLPPLAWYDVLYNLYLAEQDEEDDCPGLRQITLAERAIVSPSGLSRLVDRMVTRGVVARHQVPGDRRGAALKATPAGVALMREIWQEYGSVLEQHFAPAVAGHEEELAGMLHEAIRSLDLGDRDE